MNNDKVTWTRAAGILLCLGASALFKKKKDSRRKRKTGPQPLPKIRIGNSSSSPAGRVRLVFVMK